MLTSGFCPCIVPSLAPQPDLCGAPLVLFTLLSIFSCFKGTCGQHYSIYTNVLHGAGKISSVKVLIG